MYPHKETQAHDYNTVEIMKINIQKFNGYVYGSIQPSARLTFSKDGSHKILSKYIELLEEKLALPAPKSGENKEFHFLSDNTSLQRLVILIDKINTFSGDFRFTSIKEIDKGGNIIFILPTLAPGLIAFNLKELIELMKLPISKITEENILAFKQKARRAGQHLLPQGTNNVQFIRAAAEKHIPFTIFSNQQIIFGYGKGSTHFKSSITEKDSVIGIQIAKSKSDTNRLLRNSGLPVIPQIILQKNEQIELFVKKYGFPIVLKPANEEKGRGIHTHISSIEEATEVYEAMREEYANILLEKHIYGDGFRVEILNGECVMVYKLEAAHVTGDGKKTIRELIDAENTLPERNGAHAVMIRIEINTSTRKLLAKSNLSLDDIPELGRKITLSPTSNVSRGGSSTDFSQLHPENIDICIQAASTLGLYCAGVDLISEDASISWRDNDAVICEVNAQPQIGSGDRITIHDQMVWNAVPQFPEINLKVVDDRRKAYSEIFNRTKSRIEIALYTDDILKNGCPCQYFDSIEFDSTISPIIREEIQSLLVSTRPTSTPLSGLR